MDVKSELPEVEGRPIWSTILLPGVGPYRIHARFITQSGIYSGITDLGEFRGEIADPNLRLRGDGRFMGTEIRATPVFTGDTTPKLFIDSPRTELTDRQNWNGAGVGGGWMFRRSATYNTTFNEGRARTSGNPDKYSIYHSPVYDLEEDVVGERNRINRNYRLTTIFSFFQPKILVDSTGSVASIYVRIRTGKSISTLADHGSLIQPTGGTANFITQAADAGQYILNTLQWSEPNLSTVTYRYLQVTVYLHNVKNNAMLGPAFAANLRPRA